MYAAAVCVAPVVAGCDGPWDGEGSARGSVCPHVDPDDCRPYRLAARVLWMQSFGERTTIELRSAHIQYDLTDDVAIQLMDARNVPLNTALPVRNDGAVRGVLQLRAAYPDAFTALDPDPYRATVTFTAFGRTKGDDVAGTFDFPLVGRHDGKPRGRIVGRFHFAAGRGMPLGNVELRPPVGW